MYVKVASEDDYHRVVNIVSKKPPLLDRPGEGSYSRYDDYSHAEYRDYEEGRSFAHERRSGPPHRGVHKDESGYRWPRDDYPMNRQTEYRYFIKLHSNAMYRKVWRLSVPTSCSKQLL
ncbi:UNVERIFIED_CONTAM: hypothetical protein H355_000268 [Colinus virginianus]|nr:hypothetical protein H355_000268 [Colinus virginianus]